jgi:hypothetical protein
VKEEFKFVHPEPCPLPRRDNHKTQKWGGGHLKIFSRTTGPIVTMQTHPWGQGIKICLYEAEHSLNLHGEIARVKIHIKFFKSTWYKYF